MGFFSVLDLIHICSASGPFVQVAWWPVMVFYASRMMKAGLFFFKW